MRHLRRTVRALGGRKRRSWRAPLGTDIAPLLKSARGVSHRDEVVMELTGRLQPVLSRLDEGPAVLDDAVFISTFQYALTWLAYQGDVTAAGSTLRAYCDITASVAVLDRLVDGIATEFSIDAIAVAAKLSNTGSWREPLLVAGRRKLAAGNHDGAIALAKRALNIVSACPESQRLLMDAYRAGGTTDRLAQAGLADLRGRFCSRPFEVLVSTQSTGWNAETSTTEQIMGASYLCDCAAWLPFIAGNVVDAASPDDVWNSEGAQEIRRSVLDGDYSYCSRTLCPMIANNNLPRTEEVSSPRLRAIIDEHKTILDDGPRLIALGHDSSCNLACPSCRVDIVMANRAQNDRLDRARDTVILPLLRNREVGLHLTAWGDPFASRHYRSILEALRDHDFDGVKLSILTNGLGLTKNIWESMPHLREKIVELRVSVDAATKETYENVRRPGRWEVITENLRVMGEINSAGTFVRNRQHGIVLPGTDDAISFSLAFVVQSANFREMPAFVRLAEEVNADSVIFQRYYSFGHEGSAAFCSKDVASAAHPEHSELQAILADPIMRSPRVNQTFIAQLSDSPPS
ncbi:MAG: hypothetical protein QOC81_1095 [Thermoanaerobaculia bacterium]|jgi:hypothetical protein|nr:hypothetical protein [Thermoanaerobaculia bacterium]